MNEPVVMLLTEDDAVELLDCVVACAQLILAAVDTLEGAATVSRVHRLLRRLMAQGDG